MESIKLSTPPREEGYVRERRIAELVMGLGLGDTRSGVPSPTGSSQSPKLHHEVEKQGKEIAGEDEPEEDEQRFPPDATNTEQSEQKFPPPSPLPVEAPRPLIQAPSLSVESNAEMGEASGDEDVYFDVSEEAPTTSLPKSRPPIPGPRSSREAPVNSVAIPSRGTAPSRSVPPTPLDYVLVEKGDATQPQLKLPPVPSSSRNTETSVMDLSTPSMSGTLDTEASQVEAPPKERRHTSGHSHMTADQLNATWRRVGTQVNEVVRELFEKSKKTVIGDGTYLGFVNAVLERVPNTSTVQEGGSSFGYLIYVQSGPSVTRRIVDIKPGDIITLQDAKLKGPKGLRTYHQDVGQGVPVVAIIDEYRSRKSTVKAYQAYHQAGNQVRHTTNHISAILMRPTSPSSMSPTSWKI